MDQANIGVTKQVDEDIIAFISLKWLRLYAAIAEVLTRTVKPDALSRVALAWLGCCLSMQR